MTTAQKLDLDQLISDYATSVVDSMDNDTLVQFAYEQIVKNLQAMDKVEAFYFINSENYSLVESRQNSLGV